ncbi:MAG: hypothetical protein KDB10_22070 [Acidimicrobiales bacterium]|nr:hypothetical protein [Acidimicrobiales bacterium]
MATRSDRQGADHTFVVRADGTWRATPGTGRDPVPTTVDEILAALTSAVPAGDDTVALWEDTVLEPWPVVVAELADGALVVEATDGRRVPLGAAEARLLDHLTGWCTVGELLDRAAAGDGARRAALASPLARLVGTGRVRVARPGTPPVDDEAPADEVGDTGPEPAAPPAPSPGGGPGR